MTAFTSVVVQVTSHRIHRAGDVVNTPHTVSAEPVQAVRDLSVAFRVGAGEVRAVDGISVDIERDEFVALTGESGSGKSATSLAIMGLHDPRTSTTTG